MMPELFKLRLAAAGEDGGILASILAPYNVIKTPIHVLLMYPVIVGEGGCQISLHF
jgi:hypothetical protein